MLRKLLGLPRKAPIDAARWRRITGDLPFLRHLDEDGRNLLQSRCEAFLASKQFSGAAGFEVDDDVRIGIAVQACLPALHLGLSGYRDFVEIVVYPDRFVAPRRQVDEIGVVHEYDDELAGEAMEGGPVVLSWPDADPAAGHVGYNVVIHEFAHKLDMLNGPADGRPPLQPGMDPKAWAAAFKEAYEGFCEALDRGRDTWLDPYAAEHPSEFFAVISEAFFEDPKETRRRYPDVYDQLKAFYRQDPAARIA